MSQEALIEPLFQEENKITRRATCARLGFLALLVGLGSSLLMICSAGAQRSSIWTSPLNMPSRGEIIHHNGFDTGMNYYGGSRYGHSPRYHDPRYQDYPYGSGGGYLDYGHHDAYGDQVAYGEHGDPHMAAYRYRPGRSLDFPVGSYGGGHYGGHRGGYNDWYGGDRYGGYMRDHNDRYAGRYPNSYDDMYHSHGYGYR